MRSMNKSAFSVAFALLFSVAGFPPAYAAEATTEALLACAEQADDARRLRCFDSVVEGLRRTPAPSAAPAAAAAVPAATVAATSSGTTPAAPPKPVARPVSPEEEFGARGELKPGKNDALSAISATVTALGKKPYGELVITLSNGQVWAEIAPNSKVKLKTGDTVKIEAGALGSFVLIAPNGRSSKVSRMR
jgi:hypothetical protein